MKRLLLAAVMSVVGLANAAPVSGFNGDYAVANWTQSAGTGAINTAGAPNSISLTSGDDGSFEMSYTNFYIQFAVDTTVTFSWAYSTLDLSPFYDPFGYVLSGTDSPLDLVDGFAQLYPDLDAPSPSGATSVFVQAGQYFGFSTSSDNLGGSATTTIRGFTIDDGTIPEPSSLLLLALALAAVGTVTRQRRAV
ncbi:MAG: PEP-CTERM sorting domain-containing protein [Rubrivivax sp.]|nr:PEP-CTERM sorting domain-containing protein [Rubrivivax sp.]